MVKEIKIIADIILFSSVEKSFKFPIISKIRTSFWLPENDISTFSEFEFKKPVSSIGEIYEAKITLVKREFLNNKLNPKATFLFGTFPNAIGEGTIKEIKENS